MIPLLMSLDELKKYYKTDEADEVLEAKLQALELTIRKRTNNNFQHRAFRTTADAYAVVNDLECDHAVPFAVGDTLMISESDTMDGCLCSVKEIKGNTVTVNEALFAEERVLITKVVYPIDVKLGAVEVLKWKTRNEAANNGDKASMPIQSESISRHSVTYAQDTTETVIDADFGVPVKYTGFLKAYRKARF